MKKTKELTQAEYVKKSEQFNLMLNMQTSHLNSEIELLKMEKSNALDKVHALEKFAQELAQMNEEKHYALITTMDNMAKTINELKNDKQALVDDKERLVQQLKQYEPIKLMQDVAISTEDMQYIDHEISEPSIVGDNIHEEM